MISSSSSSSFSCSVVLIQLYDYTNCIIWFLSSSEFSFALHARWVVIGSNSFYSVLSMNDYYPTGFSPAGFDFRMECQIFSVSCHIFVIFLTHYIKIYLFIVSVENRFISHFSTSYILYFPVFLLLCFIIEIDLTMYWANAVIVLYPISSSLNELALHFVWFLVWLKASYMLNQSLSLFHCMSGLCES